MKDSVVVLGAKGMLGTDLMQCLQKSGIQAVGYDLPDFNITNSEHLRHSLNHAGIIINCAAYTNVEKAESEKELAFRVNAEAAGILGQMAVKTNTPILHISTDFVFDGELDRPYVETDRTNPLSAYGASKYAGEKAILASGCRVCIVRIEWTYGTHGVNFVTKMISAAKSGKSLRVVDDQIGSPTATSEIAKVLYDIIRLPAFPEGLFHLAAKEYISRFDMAKFIFDSIKMNIDLSPCKTSDFPSAARRPLNSRFDCGKIEKVLGKQMRSWKEPLLEYLNQLT